MQGVPLLTTGKIQLHIWCATR